MVSDFHCKYAVPMTGAKLLIRADATEAIGCGHVLRCLALAEAWLAQGGEALFFMAGAGEPLRARLARAGMQVAEISAAPGSTADALETRAPAAALGAAAVVIDGYHFDASYRENLLAAPWRLVIIDDTGVQGPYRGDLLVNSSLVASPALYPEAAGSPRLLLGPRYALIREEFTAHVGRRGPEPPLARRLLIAMGGADPGNHSLRILEALAAARASTFEITVIVGPKNPHADSLRAAAAASPHKVTLLHDVESMAPVLLSTDLAITAAGGTSYELALLGVPSIVIPISAPQLPVARALAAAGAMLELTPLAPPTTWAAAIDSLARDQTRRAMLGRRLRTLLDSLGSRRVATELRDAAGLESNPQA